MIELFSFSHNGNLDEYCDNVMVKYGKNILVVLTNGKNDPEKGERLTASVTEVINSYSDDMSFDDISYAISKKVYHYSDYVIVRLNDYQIETEKHGAVKAFISSNGEIKNLTNGMIRLNDNDRVIIGTDMFFHTLSPEGVLSDSLTSISAEEWMDFLVHRISDVNMLIGSNLTAVTFIVRCHDDIRIVR